ncbi:MAG: DUF4198 domain-containing protein [Planctomycetota bacterium]
MNRIAHCSLVLVLAGIGFAFDRVVHDTWLLTMPAADGRANATLSVRTGMDFPTSENAVVAANVTGWLVPPTGERRALPAFHEDPATKSTTCALGPLAFGIHLAAIDTAPKHIAMGAKKFNDYLLHDGLPHVLAARMDADEEGNDATEQYRKCAKVIFRVGDGANGRFAEPIGQQLEIVPLDDPTALAPRSTLRVRVLFDKAPLVRGNLCWDLPGNGEDLAGCTWTDANGEALVPIAQPGWMTVRLVHMTRPKTAKHEYESFWASCSFQVGGR